MRKSTQYILNNIKHTPQIAIVLGSGFSDLYKSLENIIEIKYSDIPDFLQTTIPGHKGSMFFGQLMGKECVMLGGRFHYYEGHDPRDITEYINILYELGVQRLLLTNAAGGISSDLRPGDLMVIDDHINFAGVNPLIGANDDTIGPRFLDMSDAYNKEFRNLIHEAADSIGMLLKSGVYIMYSGPNFETPAEIKMFGLMGADAVGMSTVPETIAAHHCGIKVGAISCITNFAAGIGEGKLSHEDVLDVGKMTKEKFKTLIIKIVELI
ncbi:MAG: purine-nucleoside phosphorylase [Clostridiales bacterium]|nr:purine-nucleoside phosphorylase [Clostridiales bacterium]